ncbi:hypothetical protein B0H17DRAFT_1200035 [Mycena rosella]|uniref:Uncharacterized protein n=1 Tax=Mycena rosella TaxID=1033263 RepID=A0AAD7GLC2_MYCRO|nr:hypothetical protein B0H17DRAFT_1200035 [Mycena rosella]
MLDFSLPLEAPSTTATQPAQYFSMTAPDVMDKNTLLHLRRLPIPAAKIIRKLIDTGIMTHHPFFVLTYWNAVVDLKHDVRRPWMKCQDWVRRQKQLSHKNPEKAAVVEETMLMLRMLPWGWKKMGLPNAEPYHNLWCFPGAHWLTGSQQNGMLELLRHKVDTMLGLAERLRFHGVELLPKDIAEDLVRDKAVLITTGHLGEINNEPHWISLVVDLSQSPAVLIYGDSFGTPIPAELLAAFRWYIGQHTPAHLETKELPMGRHVDGFLCGMLVDNSQQHFVDPSIPLSAPANFSQAQCEMFNKIARWGLDCLEMERMQVIAEDEDSDSESNHYTATIPTADSDDNSDDAPLCLGVPQQAKFTFTFPPTSPTPPPLDITVAGIKRAKGHPDEPTPTPSPAKHRIYKQSSSRTVLPP